MKTIYKVALGLVLVAALAVCAMYGLVYLALNASPH